MRTNFTFYEASYKWSELTDEEKEFYYDKLLDEQKDIIARSRETEIKFNLLEKQLQKVFEVRKLKYRYAEFTSDIVGKYIHIVAEEDIETTPSQIGFLRWLGDAIPTDNEEAEKTQRTNTLIGNANFPEYINRG